MTRRDLLSNVLKSLCALPLLGAREDKEPVTVTRCDFGGTADLWGDPRFSAVYTADESGFVVDSVSIHAPVRYGQEFEASFDGGPWIRSQNGVVSTRGDAKRVAVRFPSHSDRGKAC